MGRGVGDDGPRLLETWILTRWRLATAKKHQILLRVMAKSWKSHVCMFITYLHTTFKVPVPNGYRNQTEKFT